MNREDLISAFVERLIDQMDLEALCDIASVYLAKEYDTYTDEQLRAEVEEFVPELLEQDDD